MKTTTSGRILSSYSIVHTAVYSGEAAVLDYILNKIDVSVNPFNCEASPLKVAMKANNPKMVEMLVAKGAYYVFGDVFNNVYQKPNIEEQNKYYSIQSNRDIPISMVVEEGIIKDCPIKETLKYARVKSIIAMKIMADKASHNMDVKPQFLALASILSNSENMIMLLKMAVNRGESILSNKANAASLEQNDQICWVTYLKIIVFTYIYTKVSMVLHNLLLFLLLIFSNLYWCLVSFNILWFNMLRLNVFWLNVFWLNMFWLDLFRNMFRLNFQWDCIKRGIWVSHFWLFAIRLSFWFWFLFLFRFYWVFMKFLLQLVGIAGDIFILNVGFWFGDFLWSLVLDRCFRCFMCFLSNLFYFFCLFLFLLLMLRFWLGRSLQVHIALFWDFGVFYLLDDWLGLFDIVFINSIDVQR